MEPLVARSELEGLGALEPSGVDLGFGRNRMFFRGPFGAPAATAVTAAVAVAVTVTAAAAEQVAGSS